MVLTGHGLWMIDDPHAPGTPPGMTPLDVSLRSELARFLGKECWPATRTELLATARANNATDEVSELIARLPEGERFENLAEAWEQIGGHNESRRT